MLEDVKIIELFFARTEQAIAELAAKYGSTCKRIANNILKCEPDAEECVNDTYLAAWNAILQKDLTHSEPIFFVLPAISLPQNTTQILH